MSAINETFTQKKLKQLATKFETSKESVKSLIIHLEVSNSTSRLDNAFLNKKIEFI